MYIKCNALLQGIDLSLKLLEYGSNESGNLGSPEGLRHKLLQYCSEAPQGSLERADVDDAVVVVRKPRIVEVPPSGNDV